ncbi:hypothetical protein MRX96_059484 [Rhipicephalus microplus]
MTNLNRSDHAFPTRFQLQTGGANDVSSRISSVFDSLNSLEAKHQAWERSHKEDACSGQSYLKEDPEDDVATKPSSTSDGVFKRPWSSAGPCGPRKRPRGAARSGVDRFGSSASTTPGLQSPPREMDVLQFGQRARRRHVRGEQQGCRLGLPARETTSERTTVAGRRSRRDRSRFRRGRARKGPAERVALKKGRVLRARTDDEDD